MRLSGAGAFVLQVHEGVNKRKLGGRTSTLGIMTIWQYKPPQALQVFKLIVSVRVSKVELVYVCGFGSAVGAFCLGPPANPGRVVTATRVMFGWAKHCRVYASRVFFGGPGPERPRRRRTLCPDPVSVGAGRPTGVKKFGTVGKNKRRLTFDGADSFSGRRPPPWGKRAFG